MSHKEYLKHVGMELRIARVRAGITQAEICRKTGLNPNVLSCLELGKTNSQILTYKRIADILGVQLRDIL